MQIFPDAVDVYLCISDQSSKVKAPNHQVACVRLSCSLHSHAIVSMEQNENETLAEYRQRLREAISQGRSKLTRGEQRWRDKGLLLESRGYRLRPRYRIGWTPSWTGKDINIERCEDSHILPVSLFCHFLGRQLCIPAFATNRRDLR